MCKFGEQPTKAIPPQQRKTKNLNESVESSSHLGNISQGASIKVNLNIQDKFIDHK